MSVYLACLYVIAFCYEEGAIKKRDILILIEKNRGKGKDGDSFSPETHIYRMLLLDTNRSSTWTLLSTSFMRAG